MGTSKKAQPSTITTLPITTATIATQTILVVLVMVLVQVLILMNSAVLEKRLRSQTAIAPLLTISMYMV